MGDEYTPSAEDYASLDAAIESLPKSQPVSLNDLITAWDSFVGQVESGYSEPDYEYLNDLWCRKAIEHIQTRVTPALAASIAERVDAIDARFMEATREVEAWKKRGGHWTKWRAPKLLVGDLANDVRFAEES